MNIKGAEGKEAKSRRPEESAPRHTQIPASGTEAAGRQTQEGARVQEGSAL